MNNEALVKWLRAMVSALPHGGKRRAADTLGISPSGLSKILGSPRRSFDEKTIRLIAWIQSSKSEHYAMDKFPVSRVVRTEGLVLETRKLPDGSEFVTWRQESETDRSLDRGGGLGGAIPDALRPLLNGAGAGALIMSGEELKAS